MDEKRVLRVQSFVLQEKKLNYCRIIGHLNSLNLAMVILPISRNSLWLKFFGVPLEKALIVHRSIARVVIHHLEHFSQYNVFVEDLFQKNLSILKSCCQTEIFILNFVDVFVYQYTRHSLAYIGVSRKLVLHRPLISAGFAGTCR